MIQSKTPAIDVIYVLFCKYAQSSGVYKKISDQTREWTKLGVSFKLLVVTDPGSFELWKKADPNAILLEERNLVHKLFMRLTIFKYTKQFQPKVIYLRDVFPFRIPRTSVPVFIEVQSNLKNEIALKRRLLSIAIPLLRKIQLRHVKGFIYVSYELCQILKPDRGTRDCTVISNGIDLTRFDMTNQNKSVQKNLLFVGHPNQDWQGFDQVKDLAALLPMYQIYVVGLSEIKNSPPNLVCLGLLESSEYLEIANTCVAGIGTLALFKKGLNEASPLKVREYLAMGLPVITRYKDTDFDSQDFILELPNDSRSISEFSIEIEKFLRKWEGKRVPQSAISHISSREKEIARLKFLLHS